MLQASSSKSNFLLPLPAFYYFCSKLKESMKITFLKKAKPRKFDYKPRYYDAQKEADEKRKREIEENIKNPDRINLRREMKNKWGRHDRTRAKSRNYTIAVYIALLIAILYYIFVYAR